MKQTFRGDNVHKGKQYLYRFSIHLITQNCRIKLNLNFFFHNFNNNENISVRFFLKIRLALCMSVMTKWKMHWILTSDTECTVSCILNYGASSSVLERYIQYFWLKMWIASWFPIQNLFSRYILLFLKVCSIS